MALDKLIVRQHFRGKYFLPIDVIKSSVQDHYSPLLKSIMSFASIPSDVLGIVVSFVCNRAPDAIALALVSTNFLEAVQDCSEEFWARLMRRRFPQVDNLALTEGQLQSVRDAMDEKDHICSAFVRYRATVLALRPIRAVSTSALRPIEECADFKNCPIFAERLHPTGAVNEFGRAIWRCDACRDEVHLVCSQEEYDVMKAKQRCVRFSRALKFFPTAKAYDEDVSSLISGRGATPRQYNVVVLDEAGGAHAVSLLAGVVGCAAFYNNFAPTAYGSDVVRIDAASTIYFAKVTMSHKVFHYVPASWCCEVDSNDASGTPAAAAAAGPSGLLRRYPRPVGKYRDGERVDFVVIVGETDASIAHLANLVAEGTEPTLAGARVIKHVVPALDKRFGGENFSVNRTRSAARTMLNQVRDATTSGRGYYLVG